MCQWSYSHPLQLCFLTDGQESADSDFLSPRESGTRLSSAHSHSPPPSHSPDRSFITSAETLFPDKITFTGSRGQDLRSLGGHYSEYYVILRRFLELSSAVLTARQQPNIETPRCPYPTLPSPVIFLCFKNIFVYFFLVCK